MKPLKFLFVCLWLLGTFSACKPSTPSTAIADDKILTIAAASDMRFAMEPLRARFLEEHPDVDLRITFGSSGQLCSQILAGAKFDMFLSADMSFPERIIHADLANKSELFWYANGRLVLWFKRDRNWGEDQAELKLLLEEQVKHVAIANPEHAPYGRAAVQAIKHYGLFDQVREKLVFGDNVAQATQFVESGAADVGLIAKSLSLSQSHQEQGVAIDVAREAYEPMRQSGIVLKDCSSINLARAMKDLLVSEWGQNILEEYGLGREDD
jgi:molybdate transport system substrate-binding protein